eukprot:TRINITY_DN2591_c0_g3_i1.p3 TRINITY_DN2591_c0_g3~~TRINITY_DN2591_c0_g3_i1.p3  ORF type:complete len:138 (+),score=35.58 TRINITY_DN2591_c0_g3_i1:136-549(+)
MGIIKKLNQTLFACKRMSYSYTRRSYVEPAYTSSRVVSYGYAAPVETVVETRRSIERPITRVVEDVIPATTVYNATRYVSPVRIQQFPTPIAETRVVTTRVESPSRVITRIESPSRVARYETVIPRDEVRVTRSYRY